MVPKRLYGYYLTCYEQFYVFQKIKIEFTSVILKNSYFINCTDLLWYFGTKKEKKIQKMSDFIGFSEHMQAHFEEKITFFGRKVKKVPCIIGTI